jgi:cytochrome c oxidase assembly factor CtaG
VLVLAVAYALAYARGAIDPDPARGRQRAAVFAAGMLLLLLALVSPLCRLAAATASAHMVQHVILVALAPLFLAIGAPSRFLASAARGAAGVFASAVLHGAVIWAWHVPALYEAALLSIPVHLVMYLSLVAAGALFWSAILSAFASRAERAGVAVLVLLVTFVHTGLLGALLSFSPAPWYAIMAPGAVASGFSPLADQQLAGLIMWVPMGAIYLVAALVLAGKALKGLEEFAPKRLKN